MNSSPEIADRREDAHLLSETLPHVIHSDAENGRCSAILESLLRKKKRSAEERRLAELLTLPIEEYEQKRFAAQHPAAPIDILRHLMDANGLRQGFAGRVWDSKRRLRGTQRQEGFVEGARLRA
jgi:antitoxin component HigA of HigAB toxin-antitoxin module